MTVLVNGQPQVRKGTDEQSELEQQPDERAADQTTGEAEPRRQGAGEAVEMTDETMPAPPDTVPDAPEAPPSVPSDAPIPVLDESTPPVPKPSRKRRVVKGRTLHVSLRGKLKTSTGKKREFEH